MITALLVAAGVVACALVGYVLLQRVARQKTDTHCARCPHCGQKCLYSAKRAGLVELCPRCKHEWALPAAPASAKTIQAKLGYRAKRI